MRRLYAHAGGDDPIWIDTVGWEDNTYEDDQSFQEILNFIKDNGIVRIKAVIWNVIPNVRLDSVLSKQARLIDMFMPGEIWNNVIIVCKQSMKPNRDGNGAKKAAEQFCQGVSPQVIGYRFLSDLDEEQFCKMKDDVDMRMAFNVKTDDEVRELLSVALSKCGDPLSLVFRDCRCMDCGAEGDPRLMPLFCHMESHHVHPSSVRVVHPKPIESFHPNDVQIAEHDGVLRRPWYGHACLKRRVRKRYTCCQKKHGKPGCQVKWACCRRSVEEEDNGCRRRFGCCLEDPDISISNGCEARFICCGRKTEYQGCVELCKKCDKPWGTPAENCFKKQHNVVDVQRMEQVKREAAVMNNNVVKPKMVLGLSPIVLSKPF